VSIPEIRIVEVEQLDLLYQPQSWPWADKNRSAIDAHFERELKSKRMWNGRVLLLHRYAIEASIFRGAYFETDFASFLAWRDWDFPDEAKANCFAMGVLRSSDGAYLLGRMAKHTANAGKTYFPAGTPDPDDVIGGKVDLAGSVMRELAEETGLTSDDVTSGSRWQAVIAGPRIALMRPLRAREDAAKLAKRIRAHLANEKTPELEDVVVVHGPSDLLPEMPDFVRAYLGYVWRTASIA
jgi:8-oxo-dGTP pyrophosphatase MutT (NUDIX family)